mmetsp:Transcript_88463/g.205812  ORF Transcript_88463/g.205812 Transcript_88463/m.205812 type:complete len:222 (-) Transcript_88463:1677-2342(-)
MRTTRMKSSLLINGPVLFFRGLSIFFSSAIFPASLPSPASSSAFSESPSLPSSPLSGLSLLEALFDSATVSPSPCSLCLALASPSSKSRLSFEVPPAKLEEAGKSASSLSGSISHMCSSKKARISSLVSSPLSSPEMTVNRSSALPPLASIQTRSFAATSMRKASYSAKAWCHAHCRTFATMPCAFTSRRFCMSALLLSEVNSCRMGSTSSGISATVFVIP